MFLTVLNFHVDMSIILFPNGLVIGKALTITAVVYIIVYLCMWYSVYWIIWRQIILLYIHCISLAQLLTNTKLLSEYADAIYDQIICSQWICKRVVCETC